MAGKDAPYGRPSSPNRPRPYGRNREVKAASPINSILASSFPLLGITAKIKEYQLKKTWAECVGANISKRATPLRLIGGILHCNVSNSAWMNELSYQKSMIMTKLNERLGEALVKDIIFKIGPISEFALKKAALQNIPQRELTPEEQAFIEKTTSPIKDTELKELVKRVMGKGRS